MAKYDAGYLSPIKNKLGNAVGRRWRNLNVLAVYNGSPRNPRTASQQLQRAKFTVLTELAHTFAPLLIESMKNASDGTKRFPRALFMHLNYGAMTGSRADNVIVNYANLKLASGNMMNAIFGAPSFAEPLRVQVSVDTSNVQAAYSSQVTVNGRIRVVVYCPQAGFYVSNGSDMTESNIVVNVPASWNGLEVKVYAYCYLGEGEFPEYGLKLGDCSDSVYVGTGTIG